MKRGILWGLMGMLWLAALSACQGEPVSPAEEPDVTVRVYLDDSLPEPLDLAGVRLSLYQLEPSESGKDYVQYSSVQAGSIQLDSSGTAEFASPSDPFSMDLEADTLPEGVGADQITGIYYVSQGEVTYTLSAVAGAELEAVDLDNPQITLYNSSGRPVYASYHFAPQYQLDPQDSDLVWVTGEVQTGPLVLPVEERVDLSDWDELSRASALYRVGLIPRREYEEALERWNHF